MVKEIVSYITDRQQHAYYLNKRATEGDLDSAAQTGAEACGRVCQLAAWVNEQGALVTVCPSLEQPDRTSAEHQEALCSLAHSLVFRAMEASGDQIASLAGANAAVRHQ